MSYGPQPKDPKIRQNRLVRSTRAVLPPEEEPIVEMPQLPALTGGMRWHPLTILWWEDVWQSPMSAEFLRSDVHGLVRLALLVDQFYNSPTVLLHSEIRLAGQLFGLSPIDRRRLEWTVTKTEEAKDNHEARRVRRAQTIEIGDDPRSALES